VVSSGVPLGTCPTSVKKLVLLTGTLAFVQVTVPPAPGVSMLQVHVGPEFWVNDTKVMSPGSGSFKAELRAGLGPVFVTWIV
jgi:hypothetical protein